MPERDEPEVGDLLVGLFLAGVDSEDTVVLCSDKVSVMFEGNIVADFPTLAEGYVMLFSMIYTLHLSYPKNLTNTFGPGRLEVETKGLEP